MPLHEIREYKMCTLKLMMKDDVILPNHYDCKVYC